MGRVPNHAIFTDEPDADTKVMSPYQVKQAVACPTCKAARTRWCQLRILPGNHYARWALAHAETDWEMG